MLVLCVPLSAFAQTDSEAPETPTTHESQLFTLLLAIFDEDDSSALNQAELPRPLWRLLGTGDTDEDGSVTAEEFTVLVDGLLQGCSEGDDQEPEARTTRRGR
jgi:hypothetical protein